MSPKKKVLNLLVCLSWLVSLIFGPLANTVLARETAGQPVSSFLLEQTRAALQGTGVIDTDLDGISDTVEQAGWRNGFGGPYVTDPNNPDSDGDGLSDGEEQLYDTNPLDWKDPGLYVKYRTDYQTRKYYVWQQHGSKFFTHNSSNRLSGFRDVIARRGTTLFVGGPKDATLNISKNVLPDAPSLTTLTAVPNSCAGGWMISIPANATAGSYTLTAQKNGWTSNSFTLHVIFELNGANQDDIDVLAYNERASNHPNYQKDEIAIYFDTSYEDYKPDYDPNNHAVYGWGIGWRTDYLTRNVFENYAMPVIHGISSRTDAANALGNKVDETLTIDWFKFPNSTSNALNWKISDCTGHASLLTTFLRSAGISSRPMVVDWKDAHYDTATEVWTGSSWQVMRAYRSSEYQGPYETTPSPPLMFGIVSLRSRSTWGQQQYSQSSSDMLLVAGPDWQWDQININYNGRLYRDYLTARPGQFSTIKRWNWVQTPLQDYWGINPPTVIADCSACGTAPIGTSSLSLTSAQVNPGFETHPELAHVSRILGDYGEDLDGGGRYDYLTVEIEVEVGRAGFYTVGGVLNDTDPATHLGRMVDGITGAQVYQELQVGKQVLKLRFSGQSINEKGVAGPYLVDKLWITQLQNPDPAQLMANLVDYQSPGYLTAAYQLSDLEDGGARLTNQYSHNTSDENGDGYLDRLIVNTNLAITEPGTYRAEAELVDSQGNSVTTSEWTGSGGQVTLQFDALLNEATPYYLRSVNLFNNENRLIDSVEGTPGVYTIGPLYNLGLTASAVTTPTVTSVSPTDINGDGKYDNLNFNVNLTIPVAGEYRLEGWLEGSNGALLAWQTGTPTPLGVGSQTLSLSFPGQAINSFRIDGPYQLVALKLLQGAYTVVDEVTIAYKTPGYSFSDFEGSQTGDFVMRDNGDPNNWDMNATTWALTDQAAYSPSYSWTDSPSGNYGSGTTTLTSKSLPIGNGAAAQVSFQTCYNINTDGDQGNIDLKGSGNWAAVPGVTYTGLSNGWVQRDHVLPPVVGSNNLSFRFKMSGNGSNNSDGWYVDDVSVKLSYDLDHDSISNAIEAVADDGVTLYPDTDSDGTPDYLDTDTDGDGIPDSIEGAGDTDGDGIPNFRDLDSDNDGLSDSQEGTADSNGNHIPDFLENHANPNNDADGDNISDPHENILGHEDADGDGIWNVADPDSDNDGISDSIEAGDSDVSTPPVDTDQDGLPNFIDLDSDNDGILDSVEGNADTDGDGIPNYIDLDSDNDGMPDQWEHLHHLNPVIDDSNLDFDDDGLTNGAEYSNGTDPGNPDTDGDGMPDGWEVTHNTNPLVNDSTADPDNDGLSNGQEYTYGTNPGNPDTDGDGMPDGWEVINNFDPTVDDSQGDADEDGLSNEEEYVLDTNPNNPDTDGDGIPDGVDPSPGRVTYETYLPVVKK